MDVKRQEKGQAKGNKILSNFYCQSLPLNLLTGRSWQLRSFSLLIIHLSLGCPCKEMFEK